MKIACKVGEDGKKIFYDAETSAEKKIRKRAEDELRKRYESCDEHGHKIPNYITGRCAYCFRKLDYGKEFTYDSRIKEEIANKLGLRATGRPFDAVAREKHKEWWANFERVTDLRKGREILYKRFMRREKIRGIVKKLFH